MNPWDETRLQWKRTHFRSITGTEGFTAEQYLDLAQEAITDADAFLSRGETDQADLEMASANLAIMHAKFEREKELGVIAKGLGQDVLESLTTIPGRQELKEMAKASKEGDWEAVAVWGVTAYLALEGARSVVKLKGADMRATARDCGTLKNAGVIPRPGMTAQIVVDVNRKRVPIFGQWENSTSKTQWHNETMGRIAMESAKSGKYKWFTVPRNLRTTVGRKIKGVSDDIPDGIGVRHDGRIDLWEVRSQAQTTLGLQAKLEAIMKTLPEALRGQALVIEPSPK